MTENNDSLKTPRDPKKWTVMVYMAADKSAELDAIAVQDLREMERGANGSAHIVVQINRAWPDSYQCYEIKKSETDPRRGLSLLIDADKHATDMGEQETLEKFLTSVPAIFPAERYFLVLWGHAYGLGFGRDHNNALKLKELTASLKAFQRERNTMLQVHPELRPQDAGWDGRLELLGTNACAMSYVEAAWELRNSAQYMVASQISVPFAGWPYESILRRLPEAKEPSDLGKLVVDLYVGHYNSQIRGERVAMSLLRLEGLEKRRTQEKSRDLKTLIEEFAQAIQGEIRLEPRDGGKGREPVRDVFIAAAAGDVRPLIDLIDLCKDFGDAKSEALRAVATEVKSFLDEQFIVRHDQHPDFDDLNGIGIFAPFVTDEADLNRLQLLSPSENGHSGNQHAKGSKEEEVTGQDEYERLEIFGPKAMWPRLVYDDLRQEISPEITNSIVALDASSLQDRNDVTQIILAIDSTFNKLDRVLSSARQCIKSELHHTNGERKPVAAHAGANGNTSPRRFGQPWLKLIQPVDLDTQVQLLTKRRQLETLRRAAFVGVPEVAATVAATGVPEYLEKQLADAGVGSAHNRPARLADGDPHLVNNVVSFFAKVENAISEVERATKKGLTHPRLGLGPTQPGPLGLDGPPKMGLGLDGPPKMGLGLDGPPKMGLGLDGPPKMGLGLDGPPKMGLGDPSAENRPGAFPLVGGDLRVDLALGRVAGLFQQVGDSLRGLEHATLEVETVARNMLAEAQAQDLSTQELLGAASGEIDRAFRVLEDASGDARRTVRRVLGHPLYGIGPGGTGLGLEERKVLASAGGLDRRSLRLL